MATTACAAPPLAPRARKLAAKRALRQARPPVQPPSPVAAATPAQQEPPFEHFPGALVHLQLTVVDLAAETRPQREAVVTAEGTLPEQRLTAWQSELGRSFEYSGKVMRAQAQPFTPLVAAARDALSRFGVRYDSVLVNLYPSGESAMRFHSDPQGDSWATDTAVVSVGATRRFAFRSASAPADPSLRSEFGVVSGDVVVMRGDCQARFQHSILPDPAAAGPRISLVFKKALRGERSAELRFEVAILRTSLCVGCTVAAPVSAPPPY